MDAVGVINFFLIGFTACSTRWEPLTVITVTVNCGKACGCLDHRLQGRAQCQFSLGGQGNKMPTQFLSSSQRTSSSRSPHQGSFFLHQMVANCRDSQPVKVQRMRPWRTQLNGEIKWGCGYELSSFYGTGKELPERGNKPRYGKDRSSREEGKQCGQKKQSFVEAGCHLPIESTRELWVRNFIRHPGIPFFFILPRVCSSAGLFFSDACLMRKEGALLQISFLFLSCLCFSNFPKRLFLTLHS